MLSRYLHGLCLAGAAVFSVHAVAAEFQLENDQDALIGKLQVIHSTYEDTLPNIAREYDLGYDEIKLSNPDVDTWLPGDGKEILLPTEFVLPYAPHKGIVLNIPEMRLYYYPPHKKGAPAKVITYPLGVGREGWNTPYVRTRIIQKQKDPAWYPPESIREEHAANGDPLPKLIGPGPDNPLGQYALRLALPSYLIHGTNKPSGVGMRVSHGCIRLYPENIEQLFKIVKRGTTVDIVNQPFKLGLHAGKIYLEAHPYLQEDAPLFKDNLTSVVRILIGITGNNNYQMNWDLAKQVIHEMNGIPVVVGSIGQPADDTAGAVEKGATGTKQNAIKLRLDTKLKKSKQ